MFSAKLTDSYKGIALNNISSRNIGFSKNNFVKQTGVEPQGEALRYSNISNENRAQQKCGVAAGSGFNNGKCN